jgi:hypothetical protein
VLLSLWIAVERSAYLIVGTALIVTIFIFAPRIFEWEDAR